MVSRAAVTTGFVKAVMFATLLTNAASADVIAYDDFESYTAGAQLAGDGGDGWGTAWTAPATVTVASNAIPRYGKGLSIDATGRIANLFSRTLETPQTGETLYMGFLVRVENMADAEFLQLYLNNGGDENQGVSGGIKNVAGNPFFARVDGTSNNSSANSSVSAVSGTVYQVVLRFNRTPPANYSACRIYIDQRYEGTPDAAVTGRNAGTDTLSEFHCRIYDVDADTEIYLDELRIATSYDDALAPVLPPVIAVWDDFIDTSGDMDADAVYPGFSAVIGSNLNDRTDSRWGSTDGDYGSTNLMSGASTATNAILLRKYGEKLTMTLTLTNNTGHEHSLNGFHFDFAPREGSSGQSGPRDFILTYDSGDLDNANGTLIDSQSNVDIVIFDNWQDGDESDYPDYDYTLKSFLRDTVLADGESATFKIVFSNYANNTISSIVDNIAFTGSRFIRQPTIFIVQ